MPVTCELQLAKRIQSNTRRLPPVTLDVWTLMRCVCLCVCVWARTADVVNEPRLSLQLMWPFSTLVVTLWLCVHACPNGSLPRPTGPEMTASGTAAAELSECEGQRQVLLKAATAITPREAVSLHHRRLCPQQSASVYTTSNLSSTADRHSHSLQSPPLIWCYFEWATEMDEHTNLTRDTTEFWMWPCPPLNGCRRTQSTVI